MTDEKGTWKRYRRLNFSSKALSRRAKRAETKTTKHAHKFVITKLDSLRSAKQHIVTWLAIMVFLIVAVGVQMFWFQKAYRADAWSEGGTYAEAVQGPIDTLNPLYATTDAELSAGRLLFSSLYRYDKTGHLVNDLASKTIRSANGRTYTIAIREDGIWSDGKKVTAHDIVFTVDLMKNPEIRSPLQASWADIQATAIDDTTVVFELPSSYAAFPHALTFAILPKHVLESVPAGAMRQNTFSVSPVGSGPFTLRLLQLASDGRHKIANMSGSKNYYLGAPRVNRFELHAFDQKDDLLRSLRTGEVSAAVDIDVRSPLITKKFTVETYPVNSGVYALFNTRSLVLKDKNLRRALQLGTDITKVKDQAGPSVPRLDLPFVNSQLTGAETLRPQKYNVAKAQRLLDKEGWKLRAGSKIRTNKQKAPLQLHVVTVNDSVYERVLNELARQWTALGIEVQTESVDPNATNRNFVQTVLQPRDYDVLVYELVIGADPDVYAYWHSSQATRLGYNFANYSSAFSDDALTSARSRSEADLRNEKYKAFAQQWLDDVPAIGLYQSVMGYAHRPSVQPYISDVSIPSVSERFSDILYWSAEQSQVYKTP
ncbi:MAG TPA: peptide ABC transporter substrate-binding protein [Candidatus Saccharibacteria bacterium]|nr:peptide ABC transporter substrate-binding protein [Candidatus Saccharibacteria bacterium]